MYFYKYFLIISWYNLVVTQKMIIFADEDLNL